MSVITEIKNLDQNKIELLKRTICKGATNDELELFIHACQRTGLDPFMKQIYSVKRWVDGRDVMTVQTGIDGYRLIAERSGRYMPGRECTFSYDDSKNLISATSYVKKMDSSNQWHEVAHTVYWSEYCCKKKDGSLTGMWATKPHIMLSKCAESACLRKAFPADLSGVYTSEEMEQATETETQIGGKQEINTAAISDRVTITFDQVMELEKLIGVDTVLLNSVLKNHNVSSLTHILSTDFPTMMHHLKNAVKS